MTQADPPPRRSCRRSKTRPRCPSWSSPSHALGKSPPALHAHPGAAGAAVAAGAAGSGT